MDSARRCRANSEDRAAAALLPFATDAGSDAPDLRVTGRSRRHHTPWIRDGTWTRTRKFSPHLHICSGRAVWQASQPKAKARVKKLRGPLSLMLDGEPMSARSGRAAGHDAKSAEKARSRRLGVNSPERSPQRKVKWTHYHIQRGRRRLSRVEEINS